MGPWLVGALVACGDRASVAPDDSATDTGPARTDTASLTPPDRRLVAAATLIGAEVGGATGTAVGFGDLDGDGASDLVIGAATAGVVHVVRGPAADAEVDLGTTERIAGPPEASFGHAVAPAGDVNGDGAWDLLVGAPAAPGGGVAWLIHGAAAGALGPAAVVFSGEVDGDDAGAGVAGPGDLDGDGVPDLLVGAPARGGGDGAVYVVPGGLAGDLTPDQAAARLIGASGTRASAGRAVAGADVDGDGVIDAVVGAPGADADAGAVYLVRGPLSGDRDLAGADARLRGSDGDVCGSAVAAGDLDGDGLADLVLGAPGPTTAGGAWVLLGPPAGDLDLAAGAHRVEGVQNGDLTGAAVAVAGDVDGDGFTDVVVGAPRAWMTQGTGQGVAYLVLGPIAGAVDLRDPDLYLRGELTGDGNGRAVAGAGDFDGDGGADLLVGAPEAVVQGQGPVGKAYLVRGGL